jgi:hypothetical protein
VLIAQALIEKAMLDGMAAGFTAVWDEVSRSFRNSPWFWSAAIVIALLVLVKRRR